MQSTRKRSGVVGGVLHGALNGVSSVLWSLLLLTPVYVFCERFMARRWVWGIGCLSLLPYCLPIAVLRRMEWSSRPALYRRLGVRVLDRWTQDGGLIRGIVRRRVPEYRRWMDREAMERTERRSYGRERFHMAGLVFFLMAAGYAGGQRRWAWVFLLCLVNAVYNVYPILLQQYVRVRVRGVRVRGVRVRGVRVRGVRVRDTGCR